MDPIQQAFVVESQELLQQMEDDLLLLESSGNDPETINGIFRAAHTIKGSAGVIECRFIVEFTHVLENVLDKMRDGVLQPGPDSVELLLSCADHLRTLVACVEAETEPDQAASAISASLRDKLQGYLASPLVKPEAAAINAVQNEAETLQVDEGGAMETDNWHISLRFGKDTLRKGMDPAGFINYLSELGEIVSLTTLFDAMPIVADMDPEACYLGFEISYRTEADKSRIESVFDFVRDDCIVHIWPPHSKLADFIAVINELPEDIMRLGEILVKCGALTVNELERGLRAQAETIPQSTGAEPEAESVPKIGEVLISQGAVAAEVVEAAASKQAHIAEKKSYESRLIRVQAEKLDQLIDLVGEMVIASASANLLAQRSGEAGLVEATSVMSRLVEQIRDNTLRLRMVQIGETFQRFQRVVRDVSRELGKDIELVISGGESEMDKSMVEKIGDPLMHLVRNALDHGIETAETRLEKGKAGRGTLKLNAFHESGSIIIEIIDDGAGMNRERILQKARERELIGANDVLSDKEVFDLIFQPGFSTAEKITNISGRGVGLDVVKRNIAALRGTVEVESEADHGSVFRIRLPLTLAIIDGFLVGVGKSAYVIPLDAVVECLELTRQEREATRNHSYINLRGEVLPFVRLRDQFEIAEAGGRRENIVVVQYAGQKTGLVVDELMGEFQTVIKPLSSIFRHIKGISGSTILGTGEVALILDVQSLIQLASLQPDAKDVERI